MNSLIKITGLTKRFQQNLKHAVKSVSFDLQRGEVVTIVGSSGSGKTTLLRMISGLEIPDSGQIILNGKIINSSNIYVPPEKRNCSLVFQSYALFPNMTVNQNIYFGKNSIQNDILIKKLIEITNILEIQNRYPHQISGGQQQRVALVRALALNPSLLLMDEPLSHLDQNLRNKIRNEISNLFREIGTTALIVSHDTEDAMSISDRIIVLDEGEIIQIGTPQEVYTKPINRYSALLFGTSNFIPFNLVKGDSNYFHDEKSNCSVVSVRPHQLEIIQDEIPDDKMILEGEVLSVSLLGSHKQVQIKCNKLIIEINLPNSYDVERGKNLKLSITEDLLNNF